MFKMAIVGALSAALVAPGRVHAQSLDDSIQHASLPTASATQTASQPAASHMSSRAKGALIGLAFGATFGFMAGQAGCDFRGCAGSAASVTMVMAVLGLGVGAFVSGDRTAPAPPGRPAPHAVGAGVTIKF